MFEKKHIYSFLFWYLFSELKKKKNGVHCEAVIDNDQQSFSDSETEDMVVDETDDFIDNRPQQSYDVDVSFYGQISNQARFVNQTKNLRDAIFEQNYTLCETELYGPEAEI